MSLMKVWVIGLCALFALYLYTYYRSPLETTILQTTLDHFKLEMLSERQPLVISDRLVDVSVLRKAWFSPNIVDPWQSSASNTWQQNRYKYLVVQPQADTLVYLVSPRTKFKDGAPATTETLVAIRLRAQQVVVVPFRWHMLFEPDGDDAIADAPVAMHGLGVHDYITYFLP